MDNSKGYHTFFRHFLGIFNVSQEILTHLSQKIPNNFLVYFYVLITSYCFILLTIGKTIPKLTYILLLKNPNNVANAFIVIFLVCFNSKIQQHKKIQNYNQNFLKFSKKKVGAKIENGHFQKCPKPKIPK